MDIEKRARRQSRRVIISEIIMVIAVIATVSLLAFIVSGYWVGSDFRIERQGLLQVYSTPTGADVSIDNTPSSWLQRTNTSRTLSAGEHTIVLTKDGYDSWSRTINIAEGLLYRLHYPRLFLKERVNESALSSSAKFATVSPDRSSMLLADDTTTWQLLNLDTESIKPQKLDLSEILPFSGQATYEILETDWASDNEHLLLKLRSKDLTAWLLLNVKNPANSVNLTKEFNADFAKIEILDSSASNLLVVLNNNLHRIDVPAKQISAVLASEVTSFDYYNQDVIYSTSETLNLLKLGSGETTVLAEIPGIRQLVITKFYDDEYIGLVGENSIKLYLKKDLAERSTFSLSFSPEKVKVGASGEAIVMSTGGHIATLDMEAQALYEWSTDTDSFGWLDSSMIYAVKDATLNVYDFNGLNHRTLSTDVSSRFPVTITSDKYLYYFRDNHLIREYLYEK